MTKRNAEPSEYTEWMHRSETEQAEMAGQSSDAQVETVGGSHRTGNNTVKWTAEIKYQEGMLFNENSTHQ